MNNFNAVLEKLNEIQEIVESRPVGTYIYRGEAEHYKNVSSNLYRFCCDQKLPIVYPAGIKSLLESSVRKFGRFTDETEKSEYVDMMQHYGGLTDRIDFTSDYLIALFFACEGTTNKDGRIIALVRDKPGFHVRTPEIPNNRITTQKSVFVIPHEGFIDTEQDEILKIINIPKNLKRDILQFLRKHHGISVETIYGDFSGAIRLQRVYLETTSHYLQGNDWINKCQYDLAIKKFDEAIQLDSNYAAAYQGRGVAYAYKDEDKMAIDNFSEAIETSQYNAKSYLSRGNIYAKIGNYKQAITNFEKAERVQMPRDNIVLPRIHLCLGNAYSQIEEYEDAINILEHAIQRLPDLQDPLGWRPSDDTYNIAGPLYYHLGTIHAKISDEARAISCFKKAIDWSQYKHQCRSYFHTNISEAYMRLDQMEQAIEYAEKAIDPLSSFVIYLNRGNFYANAKVGKPEKAIEDFNEAIKNLESSWYNSLTCFFRGQVYAKINNLKNAISNFNNAAQLQNYHKWLVAAFYNRHNAYLKINNAEKSEEDLNNAKELYPELTENSHPRFVFFIEIVHPKPDIYLYLPLHGWKVDLSS